MKVVLDTNVIISGLFWKGPPHEILMHIQNNDTVEFVQSINTFNEVETVVQRGKFVEIMAKRNLNASVILESLMMAGKFYHISQKTKNLVTDLSIEDQDDLKFIELALESSAQYIVSGDPHLLKIGKFESIKILTPAEFLKTFYLDTDH